MVEVEEVEDEEEHEETPEEAYARREKDHEYLQFKREMDSIKRKYDTKLANSDKMKDQGNGFFSLGLYMQAATMYSEALELQPENPVLWCNRSMAYLKQAMPDLALEDAEESLRLDSGVTNIKAYWRKAQALVDLKRFEESEACSDLGLALQPSNQHLNAVRKKSREGIAFKELCKCEWVCQVQNGIEKRVTFREDLSMEMKVFGHVVPATYSLSLEGRPRSVLVTLKPPDGNRAGTGPPPPPMIYIFEFHDDGKELWMCHPVNTTEMPTVFEGPGFDKLRRYEINLPEDPMEKLPMDERCQQYIMEMNDAMPLIPAQLPEQPSEDQINVEVQLLEALSKLKQRYGMHVHQRAVELAKDPSKAGNPTLEKLATRLQRRFIVRKIIPAPKEEIKETKDDTSATTSAPESTPGTSGATSSAEATSTTALSDVPAAVSGNSAPLDRAAVEAAVAAAGMEVPRTQRQRSGVFESCFAGCGRVCNASK